LKENEWLRCLASWILENRPVRASKAVDAALVRQKRAGRQYSLRRLLGAVLVLAALCGALALNAQRARRQQAAVREIQRLGGRAFYDFQVDRTKVRPESSSGLPRWLRSALGDDFFFGIAYVDLGARHVDDQALAPLADLPSLRWLELSLSQVGDAGMSQVARLSRLERLGLENTRVTDQGLAALRRLRRLECLYLDSTAVTPAGLAALRAALPGCRVETGGPLVSGDG
jgi:hypothetical protein